MEIDILTGSILIGLFLMNVILIFLDSHQRKVFRQTEKRLRDALLKKIEMQLRDTLLSTKAHLQDALLNTEKQLRDALLKKIEMQLRDTLLSTKAHLQDALLNTEKQLQDKLLKKIEEVEHLLKQYRASTFDYQSPWWQDYSWLYRHVRGWQCEECQLSLNLDRQYLHTHHISGTQHNDPNDLKALCIACHSEQPGTNHHRLTTLEDYPEFMEKYGEQRKVQLDAILSESE